MCISEVVTFGVDAFIICVGVDVDEFCSGGKLVTMSQDVPDVEEDSSGT